MSDRHGRASASGAVRAPTAINWLGYGAARAAAGLIGRLPPGFALGLARVLGDLCHLLLRSRRALAEENLRLGLDLPPGDPRLRRLSRAAFHHPALVATEMLLVHRRRRTSEAPLAAHATNVEVVERARALGRGLVVVTGHIGSWEVLGAIAAERGVPVHVVHRPLDNPLIDRWVQRLRSDFGTRLVGKRGAMKTLARALSSGENVALLMDQYGGRHGLELPFLGRETPTFGTAARLARRFGVPMLAAFALRGAEPLEFQLAIEPIAEPDPTLDREEDVIRMTRAINDVLSRVIRAHPDQWLWLHRRWRARKQPRPSESAAGKEGHGTGAA